MKKMIYYFNGKNHEDSKYHHQNVSYISKIGLFWAYMLKNRSKMANFMTDWLDFMTHMWGKDKEKSAECQNVIE